MPASRSTLPIWLKGHLGEVGDTGVCRFWLSLGAARGIRTPDPIITNDVLYQLSYCGFTKEIKNLLDIPELVEILRIPTVSIEPTEGFEERCGRGRGYIII
jgi:hypothetical protein